MAIETDIELFRGEAVTLNFTMDPVEDISGWTLAFTAARSLGDPTKSIEEAGVVVSGAAGTFKVVLETAQTDLSAGVYHYDVWRTDAANERVLAIGTMTISDVVRLPA